MISPKPSQPQSARGEDMTADNDLRRIALVAQQTGISKPTLYRAARKGRI